MQSAFFSPISLHRSADQETQTLSWEGTVSQQATGGVSHPRRRMVKSRWPRALCCCKRAQREGDDLSTDFFSPLPEYASSEGVYGSASPLGYPVGGTVLYVSD